MLRRASHNADAGHSTGSAPHSGCSGSDEAAGASSAWSQTFRLAYTTTLTARRWDAKGGPEGRCSEPGNAKAPEVRHQELMRHADNCGNVNVARIWPPSIIGTHA